jgi:hypothetical protein
MHAIPKTNLELFAAVCMVGGMVNIEFRGKGMSYVIDLGVV